VKDVRIGAQKPSNPGFVRNILDLFATSWICSQLTPQPRV
jgi:hypothetical protein